jgi:hypothetical protein
MSQENVQVVREPLRVREKASRTLDQRLALRFPRPRSVHPGTDIHGEPNGLYYQLSERWFP